MNQFNEEALFAELIELEKMRHIGSGVVSNLRFYIHHANVKNSYGLDDEQMATFDEILDEMEIDGEAKVET
jgi:hypothetical protein